MVENKTLLVRVLQLDKQEVNRELGNKDRQVIKVNLDNSKAEINQEIILENSKCLHHNLEIKQENHCLLLEIIPKEMKLEIIQDLLLGNNNLLDKSKNSAKKAKYA